MMSAGSWGSLMGALLACISCWAQENGGRKNELKSSPLSEVPALCPLQYSEYPYVTSQFGMRYHPMDRKYRMHYGIDLACSKGFQFVHATGEGIVRFAGEQTGLGKNISIAHPSGYESGYGHLSEIYVVIGDRIQAGEVIGVMGQSGMATGYHLHYSLRKNGKWVDPLPYLTLYESAVEKKDAEKASGSRVFRIE